MLRFIFHISDVHIDIDRVENLMNSFNILVQDILAKGPENSMLLILGDIFENKTLLTTDDINIFDHMMSVLCEHNIVTFIIIGNHDFNINSSHIHMTGYKSREFVTQNSLTLPILTKPYPNVKCLTYTQVYSIPNTNIELHVYSIVDNQIPCFCKTSTTNKTIKIALLHDSINGAKYDNGQTVENMRFSISDFDKYDYTMLGDIHKPQFLTDTMAYSGSFVQKNKGEGIDHGYILWDLEAVNTTGFHFIPMKNLTIKITAFEDKSTTMPDILPDQNIIHVQLWHKRCTGEYITKLVDQIKLKYKMLNRVINRDSYELQSKAKTIDELKDFKEIDHSACIRELLKGQSETDIAAVIAHHKEKLQNMRDINHVNYNINYLAWSNILCYGENNYINFNTFEKAIVVLNGKNKYGKSSIIDIIIRILFNECERGYKKDIVNKNKHTGYIKISISIQQDEYIIEQVLHKTGVDTTHRVYKNGENITKSTINETYIYLSEIVGIGNYIDFVNMTTALQNRKFLVDMKEEEMLNLLIKLLNIEILEDINKQTKARQRILLHDINKNAEEQVKTAADIGGLLAAVPPQNGNADAKTPESVTGAAIAENIANLRRREDLARARAMALSKQYEPAADSYDPNLLEGRRAALAAIIGGHPPENADLPTLTATRSALEKEQILWGVTLEKLGDLFGGLSASISGGSPPEYAGHTSGISPTEYEALKAQADEIRGHLYRPSNYIPEPSRAGKHAAAELLAGPAGRSGISTPEAIRADLKGLYEMRKPVDSTDYAGPYETAAAELVIAGEGLSASDGALSAAGISLDLKGVTPQLIMLSPNIDESTYNKHKAYISSSIMRMGFVEFVKLCSDINYLKSVKERIAELKKIVFNKKTIISTDYIGGSSSEFLGVILPNKATYFELAGRQLPDYKAMSDEHGAISARLKKYNDNYGEMRFSEHCECCASNKVKISTIDISADNARLADISGIIAEQDKTIKAHAESQKYSTLIKQYEADIKANADIIANNKLYDELCGLVDMYDLYVDINSKKSQVEIYENITAENIKISLAIKHKNICAKYSELKILCENLSKKLSEKNAAKKHNEKLTIKINKLENELLEVEKATQYLSIVKLSEKYDADNSQLLSLQNKIIEYDIAQCSAKIIAGRTALGAINVSITKLNQQIDVVVKHKELEEIELKLSSILNNKKISDELELINHELSDITPALADQVKQQQAILVREATLVEKNRRLAELTAMSDADRKELRFLTMYQKCVDKKKGISQQILTDLCNLFNRECNKILHQISDFELEITVDAAQTLRIYTIDGGVKIPAAMASGYQKFVIDMIMRIVLTTILTSSYSNNISSPNMLIIDEGFGCLDNKNFLEVAGIMKQLKNNFKCIIVITHITELKSYADEIIDITRTRGYSRIAYEGGNVPEVSDDHENKSADNPMLRMTILEEQADFAARLAESRIGLNEKQAIKRAEILEARETAKKEKAAAAIKIREEAKTQKAIELSAKEAAKAVAKAEAERKKEETRNIKAQAKSDKENKATELERIVTDSDLSRGYLIEILGDTCKCKACYKTFVNTDKKIVDHITSSSYTAKHRKYIKSLI